MIPGKLKRGQNCSIPGLVGILYVCFDESFGQIFMLANECVLFIIKKVGQFSSIGKQISLYIVVSLK